MPSTTQASQSLPQRHFPMRTCVACRTERQKREFIRIVRSPEGIVSLDTTGRANGRGAYICADGSCWAQALKRKSIEHALSAPLPVELRLQLERRELIVESGVGGVSDGS